MTRTRTLRFRAHIRAQGSAIGTQRLPKGVGLHARLHARLTTQQTNTPQYGQPPPGQQRHHGGTGTASRSRGTTSLRPHTHTQTQLSQLSSRGSSQPHSTKARLSHPNPKRGLELFMHRATTAVARGILKALSLTLSSGGAQPTTGLKEDNKLPHRTLQGDFRRELRIAHTRARHQRYVGKEVRLSHNADRGGWRGSR